MTHHADLIARLLLSALVVAGGVVLLATLGQCAG